jgi:beta-glucosidase
MPQPFLFGASTSAHQVEGGNHNDWTEWEKADPARHVSGSACDHYHRFREDFDIARSLGHNAHRFSIEWSRVEPEEGNFNEKEIAHYREVIRALRERGLTPFVTLWHFTLPTWFAVMGGTQNKNFPKYFARYAAAMARAFKGDAPFWITVNEPEIYAANACFTGRWPPQKKGIIAAYRSMVHSVRAHRLAYRAIKDADSSANVGASVNLTYFEAAPGVVNRIRKFFADRFWNGYFLDHVRRELDFIGVNYYFHNRIKWGFNKNENKKVSDMGWEIYPEGMYRVIRSLKKYQLPVYITENGLADARDAQRAAFLREHLDWIKRAMNEGADVRGYLHWSLMDNFEWDKGFGPRFGLVEVNYKTMQRIVRPSAIGYKKIIEKWNEE